jgi:hypothetical protein
MFGSGRFEVGAVSEFEDILVFGTFLEEALFEGRRLGLLFGWSVCGGSVIESFLFGSGDFCAAELL